jgi:hypothetical protein
LLFRIHVALIHDEDLQATKVTLSTTVCMLDSLVVKVRMHGGRLNVAAFYRPLSTSKYGMSTGQFCRELEDLLDELLGLPGQPLICGDFNCPGSDSHGIDSQLEDTLVSHTWSNELTG